MIHTYCKWHQPTVQLLCAFHPLSYDKYFCPPTHNVTSDHQLPPTASSHHLYTDMAKHPLTFPSSVSYCANAYTGLAPTFILCSMYIHTYIHAKKKKMQILLPLGGHAHLAEPGCLCTKQALGACASKLLENGLGTRRRTSYLLAASGVGTLSPTWTTAVE